MGGTVNLLNVFANDMVKTKVHLVYGKSLLKLACVDGTIGVLLVTVIHL